MVSREGPSKEHPYFNSLKAEFADQETGRDMAWDAQYADRIRLEKQHEFVSDTDEVKLRPEEDGIVPGVND